MKIAALWLCFLAAVIIGAVVMAAGGWKKLLPRPHVNRYATSDYDNPLRPTEATIDSVMGSASAVSNGHFFGMPPAGYQVFFNGNGSFAPAYDGQVVTNNGMVRTNLLEAIIASWRLYEMRNSGWSTGP